MLRHPELNFALYSILVNLFFVGDLLKSGNPGFNEVHLLARKLDLEKLQQHNSLIQMGLQRMIKLTEDLSNLIKKNKAKIISSNSKYSHSEASLNKNVN